jgi:hypothetical protein
VSSSGHKALYLCTHRITIILHITPYSSVYSPSPCLYTCVYIVPVARRPLFPAPVSRQGYAVGLDRGNRGKGNSVNNTIHTVALGNSTDSWVSASFGTSRLGRFDYARIYTLIRSQQSFTWSIIDWPIPPCHQATSSCMRKLRYLSIFMPTSNVSES